MNFIISGVNLFSTNRGVQALGFGAIEVLNKIFPKSSYTVLSQTGLEGAVGNVNQISFNKSTFIKLYTNPKSKNALKIINHLSEASCVVDFTEGDSFSDLYGSKRFLKYSLYQKTIQSRANKYIYFPQTYGPFQFNHNKLIAKSVLQGADFCFARDSESLKLINSLGLKNIAKSIDVAFYMHSIKPKDYKKPKGELIGINPSGLIFNSEKGSKINKKAYKKAITKLVTYILHNTNYSIVFIPHTYTVDSKQMYDNDYAATNYFYKQFYPTYKKRLKIIDKNYNAKEIKGVISECKINIGSRMHACIASLSQSIPTIGLSYSRKFKGTFRNLGVENYVVDCVANKNFSDELVSKYIEISAQCEKVSKKLTRRNKIQKGNTLKIFTEILNDKLEKK